MSAEAILVTATFTTPQIIKINPSSLLWLLPIAATIAIIYKAMKLPEITAKNFIKEAMLLFGSIIVFMVIIALALYALAWLITE